MRAILSHALLLVLAVGTMGTLAAEAPTVQVELSGCSDGLAPDLLTRALELELREAPARVVFAAAFECPSGLRPVLSLQDDTGNVLAHSQVELADVPLHERVRLLALVWAELAASTAHALAVQAEQSASPASAAATQQAARALESAPVPSEPPAAQLKAAPAHSEAARVSPTTRGHRQALFPRGARHADRFEAQAGVGLRYFTNAATPLLGVEVGMRLAAFDVRGVYAQGTARTVLGDIDATLFAGLLDAALVCLAWRALDACALAELTVGRGSLDGKVADAASALASRLDALFMAGALALSVRASHKWLGLELATRAGFARGPSARALGQVVSSLEGPFLGVTLAALVQP